MINLRAGDQLTRNDGVRGVVVGTELRPPGNSYNANCDPEFMFYEIEWEDGEKFEGCANFLRLITDNG